MYLLPTHLIVSGMGLTFIIGLALVFVWWRRMEYDFIGMNDNAIVFKRNGPISHDLVLGSGSIKTIYMDCNTAGDVRGFKISTGWLAYPISASDVDYLQIKHFAETNLILFIKRYPLGAGEIENVIFDPMDPF